MFLKRLVYYFIVSYNWYAEGGFKKFIICYFLFIRAVVLMVFGVGDFSIKIILGLFLVLGRIIVVYFN